MTHNTTLKKVSDIPTNKIQYYILANLRHKLQIRNEQMGVYTTMLEAIMHNRELSLATFWLVVEQKSALLERRLNENKDINFLADADLLYNQIKAATYSEANVNFTMANVSQIRNNKERHSIRLRQHYMRMPCVCNRFGSAFFIALTIVDGKLCWSLSYSESRLSTNIVNDLIAEIFDIIGALIAAKH